MVDFLKVYQKSNLTSAFEEAENYWGYLDLLWPTDELLTPLCLFLDSEFLSLALIR